MPDRPRPRPRETAAGHAAAATAGTGYLAYRVTNPTSYPLDLVPPFQQVLVQKAQPVPGKVYNILYVAVKNGTAKTFTAADGLTVRVPGFTGTKRVAGNSVPDPDGERGVEAGPWIVFYIMGKKYYPLSPQVAAGFQIQAGGRSSTLVPGPSGIILSSSMSRPRSLKSSTSNVAYGQGAQGGRTARQRRHARHGHQRGRRRGSQPHRLRRPFLIDPAAGRPISTARRPATLARAPGRRSPEDDAPAPQAGPSTVDASLAMRLR